MPNEKMPKEKVINGQVARRVDSPLKHWPGCVYVPRELSPTQFDTYWKKRNELNDQRGATWFDHGLMQYSTRQHMILEWHIQGVDVNHIKDESGMQLPAISLASFVIAATRRLIEEGTSLPNLPGWSETTTPTSANGAGKRRKTPSHP